MPSCAIISCRKRSQVCSVVREGISFHRFPTDLGIRKLWIETTGRIDWIPTKCSTICSQHFDDDNYITTKSGKRNLKSGVYPHKYIVMCCSSSLPSTSDTVTKAASTPDIIQSASNVDEKTCQNTPTVDDNKPTPSTPRRDKSIKPRIIEQQLLSPSNATSPRKRKLQNIIITKEHIIKKQRLQIKRIQAQNRRLKRKINKIEDILFER
ncbi:THAP domain-containing protein 6-like [Pieris rapae]|uniref:THAP domain-containing protein 6-like n=1 Tax=Pieris rapae TaxID=64459 RepID=UPI001E27B15A|nr:THAP domain-containing protein 6-like [Pieris rapae]